MSFARAPTVRVIPAKAGIQAFRAFTLGGADPRFAGVTLRERPNMTREGR